MNQTVEARVRLAAGGARVVQCTLCGADGRETVLSDSGPHADPWEARAAAAESAAKHERETGAPAYVTDLTHAPVVRLAARAFARVAEDAKRRVDERTGAAEKGD